MRCYQEGTRTCAAFPFANCMVSWLREEPLGCQREATTRNADWVISLSVRSVSRVG